MYATAAETVRILLADDHKLFRETLRHFLEAEPDFVVVDEASDGDEAVALTRRYQPDILLLDIAMPKTNGLTAVAQLAGESNKTRIILVTGAFEGHQLLEAFELGAYGFVLKESGARQLLDAIRSVHGGEYYVGRELMVDLVRTVRDRDAARAGLGRSRDFGLTPRERQIVSAVVNAYQNKEIAQALAISEKTVKHHLTNIFNKVGVSNRLELALFALHHQLDTTNVGPTSVASN
jgi:DNA-binding NarL/FixJ family response regulator